MVGFVMGGGMDVVGIFGSVVGGGVGGGFVMVFIGFVCGVMSK